MKQDEKSLRYEDGHYCVGIPWKPDQPVLPDNRRMAIKRLENTEKRLIKSPAVAKAYREVIKLYTDKGYIRQLPLHANTSGGWFLPHFPVLRPEKSTTKYGSCLMFRQSVMVFP